MQTSLITTPHVDQAHCRQTLSGGSRSFWVASHLLPARLRDDACGLYAFCRDADDLIDEGGDPDAAMAQLSARLDAIYAGSPADIAVDRVLAQLVVDHAMPRALLDALLEGFSWDAAGRRYDNLDELEAYAARVAGTVGVMMAVLMGVRDAQALARAADLGVAMQLTNIARDVGEDARRGRVYLPIDALSSAGLSADTLIASPEFSPALAQIIEGLLTHADTLYTRAESGIPSLPTAARPGIYAARLLYAEIGHNLRRLGGDSISQRSIVNARGKCRVVANSFNWLNLNSSALDAPVLPACAFLIDAVTHTPHTLSVPRSRDNPLQVFYQRVIWMLDLFAALEAREQPQRTSTAGPAGHAKR